MTARSKWVCFMYLQDINVPSVKQGNQLFDMNIVVLSGLCVDTPSISDKHLKMGGAPCSMLIALKDAVQVWGIGTNICRLKFGSGFECCMKTSY